ncbi:MAG: hypothetical protein ACYTG5_10710, partial [Planctomycetota bacterium]
MNRLAVLATSAILLSSHGLAQNPGTPEVHAEAREWVAKLRDPSTRAKAQKELLRIGLWGRPVIAESLEESVEKGDREMVRVLLETIERMPEQVRKIIPLLRDLAPKVASEDFILLMRTIGTLAPFYQDRPVIIMRRLSPALQEQLKKMPPRRWGEAIQLADR